MGLFAATYVPTFVIVHFLSHQLASTVPMIIGISSLIALGLMWLLCSRAHFRWSQFGFRATSSKYVIWAFGAGIPIAIVLTWLDHRFGAAGPLAGLLLPWWKAGLYVGLGAPLQEEIIFRGLIQGGVTRTAPGDVSVGRIRISHATLIVATLFATIHLEVAVFTAVAAFVLGIIAGELRKRSGSLIPAVIVHVLFNAGSFLWIAAP